MNDTIKKPHYWTSNNSTYLRIRRKASSKQTAIREALDFLRGELMGEGKVVIFDSFDTPYPTIIFERSIHTAYRCIRQEVGKEQRTIKL